MTTPTFGDLIKLPTGGLDALPDINAPYYVGAADGLFLHRRMLIGRGLVHQQKWPSNFMKLDSNGIFKFDADPIPKELMAQVVDFFTTVYDRQSTEAAVLLTMHAETKQWRVFVPTQLVSHGGVNYVFEPTHIRYPWVLVGSIHSHCDFGAGHSGTDTNDADGFDGLHCTIGMLKRNDPPQIVAMVAMNKQLFHYNADLFPKLFDFSDVRCAKAPEWWYRYVEDTKTKTKPVGFELYEKYDRPTTVKSETRITHIGQPSPGYKPKAYNSNDWFYSEKAKRMVHKTWNVADDGTITYPEHQSTKKPEPIVHRRGGEDFIPGLGYARAPRQHANPDDWDEWFRYIGVEDSYDGLTALDYIREGYEFDTTLRAWIWTGNKQTVESREFNARQMAERGTKWDGEGRLIMADRRPTEAELIEFGLEEDETYWEDLLPRRLVDRLMDSNLVTDEDLDQMANLSPREVGRFEFWQQFAIRKAVQAVALLQELDYDAKLVLKKKEPLLLPASTEKPQHHQKGTN